MPKPSVTMPKTPVTLFRNTQPPMNEVPDVVVELPTLAAYDELIEVAL